MNLFFESSLDSSIKNEIDTILQKCSLLENLSVKLVEEEPELKKENNKLIISLTKEGVSSQDLTTPQLKS